MEGLLITHPGMEDIAAQEVGQILGKKATCDHGAVRFPIPHLRAAATLSYKARSALRILVFWGSFPVTTLSSTATEIKRIIKEVNFSTPVTKHWPSRRFSVVCQRAGKHTFTSVDLQNETVKVIKKQAQGIIDHKQHDFLVYLHVVGNQGYIGLDVAQQDLSKREYKLVNYGGSLKGTVAYGLLSLAGYTKKSVLVDPFCGTGAIPLEAYGVATKQPPREQDCSAILASHLPKKKRSAPKQQTRPTIYAFDPKQKYVQAAKKNAAASQSTIRIARQDPEWLDTVLEKNSVDCIVTQPPVPSKIVAAQQAHKLYKDLFYNAQYILKQSGKLVCITSKPDPLLSAATQYPFRCDEKREAALGKATMTILVLSKSAEASHAV